MYLLNTSGRFVILLPNPSPQFRFGLYHVPFGRTTCGLRKGVLPRWKGVR